MMGRIISAKRMAVHDGPGLRTTLFFKGCPLRCRWCHNPEGILREPEMAYVQKKCLHCGECASLCRANRWEEGGHLFDRIQCTACGRCEAVCLGDALVFYGRDITADEAAEMLLKDRAFYASSGGGITLSGGEPLLQPDFAAEILKRMKREEIHTAVDTSGFASREAVEKVMPWTDLFLYDVKAADSEVHRRCTGQGNERILDNLQFITEARKAVEIRIPYVPTMNDREMAGIAEVLSEMKGIELIRLLPYHPYATSKYESIGKRYMMPDVPRPGRTEMEKAVAEFRRRGLNAVDGGHLE